MSAGPFTGPRPTAAPFAIVCACGERIDGRRQVHHQVVRCPRCAAERFVLPVSPLPDPPAREQSSTISQRPLRPARPRLAVLVVPIVALLAASFLTVVALLRPDPRPTAKVQPASEERLDQYLSNGRAAVAEGAYLRAARDFDAAGLECDRLGGRPAKERRRIEQLRRQAALLGDLLAESPGEILRHAVGLPDADWREVFQQRYAGRALLLDDTISRDPAGRYQHGLRIVVLGGEARLDLGRLRLLNELPLIQPQRVLLGLRLAEARRDAAGWVLLPEPESAVLLTDPEMVAGLSIALDAELREVLRRQQTWLDLE